MGIIDIMDMGEMVNMVDTMSKVVEIFYMLDMMGQGGCCGYG